MSQLGFVNRGGTWILPIDPTFVVEFPAGQLAVQSVRLRNGNVAEVIGIEDIIVDRVAAK
ncbi:MAG: hypothetical protein ACLQVD_00080 [Capsulimonadaceae bacterium]